MNSVEHPASSTASREHRDGSTRAIAIWLIVLAILFVALVTSGLNAVEQLLLGWLYFPFRVIPRMTIDWPSVVAGSLAIIGFVVCLHVTLRWLLNQNTSAQREVARRGNMRTTVALAFLLLLLFAAGTAMVGTVHQVVWLLTGRKSRSAEPVAGIIEQARSVVRRAQQNNNLKQTGLAVHNFHDMHSELPAGGTVDDRGRQLHGWAIYNGPVAGYSAEGMDFTKPWNAPPNDRLYRCALHLYINPAIPEIFDKDGFGLSHVAGNANVLSLTRIPDFSGEAGYHRKQLQAARTRDDASLRNLPLRFKDITDGLANTLLIGDAAGHFKPWGHPANLRDPALGVGQSPDGFGGPPGKGGAQFVMCDGSVRFISNRIDRKVLDSLGTPAGGEAVDLDGIKSLPR